MVAFLTADKNFRGNWRMMIKMKSGFNMLLIFIYLVMKCVENSFLWHNFIKLFNRKSVGHKTKKLDTNYKMHISFDLDYRLAELYILTSNVPSPETPSTYSPHWITRYYRKEPYGAVGTLDFNPQVKAQHLAVISVLTNAPLSLAEVIIYGAHILFIPVCHH